MPTFTTSREATKDEMAREIDRCHKVIAELEAALAALAKCGDPTNHHNALLCPYCNPRRLQWAEPAARAIVPDREAVFREALLFGLKMTSREHGWGTVPYMDNHVYDDAEKFRRLALAAMQETKL